MSVKPAKIFIGWTILLSVTFAVLLLSAIIDRYGFWLSLFYTSLGVCVIWLVYFGIGKFIGWVVNEEIKQRNLVPARSEHKHRVE